MDGWTPDVYVVGFVAAALVLVAFSVVDVSTQTRKAIALSVVLIMAGGIFDLLDGLRQERAFPAREVPISFDVLAGVFTVGALVMAFLLIHKAATYISKVVLRTSIESILILALGPFVRWMALLVAYACVALLG